MAQFLFDDIIESVGQVASNLYRNNEFGLKTFHSSQSKEDVEIQQVIQNILCHNIAHDTSNPKSFHALLHFQPYVSMFSNEIVGFEALMRFPDGSGGLRPPSTEWLQQINIGHNSIELLSWVFGNLAHIPPNTNKRFACAKISVNVEPPDLLCPGFCASVDLINAHLLHRGYGGLQIELTERSSIEDSARFNDVALNCHQAGVSISLDDFGTNCASIKNLYELPITLVKLDKFFIDGIESPKKLRLIEDVVRLCRSQFVMVLMEGVENRAQISILEDCRVDFVQGYYYSKAVPFDEINSLPEFHGY